MSKRLTAFEQELTEQHREIHRDTKTLIREVAFLQGSLGARPRSQENDPDGVAEDADQYPQ